jgi:hypothetical protein
MKIETLQKYGGLSIISGSLLLTVYSICFSLLLPVNSLRQDYVSAVLNPNWIWVTSVAFFGVLFMMFGFTAVYSKIRETSGTLGFCGYIILELAYLFQACKITWEICLWPVIASNASSAPLLGDKILLHSTFVAILNYSAMVSILLGIILFCIALINSKVFSKYGGILILTGALLYGLGPMLSVIVAIGGIFIFSAGCFIIALKLLSAKTTI